MCGCSSDCRAGRRPGSVRARGHSRAMCRRSSGRGRSVGELRQQDVASTITIGHNVTAGAGSVLGLGCQPNDAHQRDSCGFEPDGTSVISVGGNVTATDAFLALLNGITVGQNVTLSGGGGGGWAEKSNTIGGNFNASDITPDWFGALYTNASIASASSCSRGAPSKNSVTPAAGSGRERHEAQPIRTRWGAGYARRGLRGRPRCRPVRGRRLRPRCRG